MRVANRKKGQDQDGPKVIFRRKVTKIQRKQKCEFCRKSSSSLPSAKLLGRDNISADGGFVPSGNHPGLESTSACSILNHKQHLMPSFALTAHDRGASLSSCISAAGDILAATPLQQDLSGACLMSTFAVLIVSLVKG